MTAIKFPYLAVCCCLAAVLTASISLAQSLPDSVFYQQSIAALQDRYKNEMGSDRRLYIGAEYAGAGQRAKGTPFFLSDSILNGAVHYHGIWYTSLGLQYDLISEDLLISDFTNTYTIRLPSEKVDSFSIQGHFFLHADSSASLAGGYYERLYQGRISLLVSHQKRVTFPASTEQQPYYRQYDDYFLVRNGQWDHIGDRGDLISLLKDRKEEVRKFIRTEKGESRKNFEQLLIEAVTYYDQLN